ncbi:hypothetical protein GGR57DRAFT_518136 [Xylariaceae sp. FL1272]|nr:hypothetical protein GGR57DRAFT_518136 [Xylariaceae sp. FL1272]
MHRRRLPSGWQGDPPEHKTEAWKETESRAARAEYFLATRPSQIFIHYVAKDLRNKIKAVPGLPQSIEDIDAETLSSMRGKSVLEVAQTWRDRGIWNKSWDDVFLTPALKGFVVRPSPTSSTDEWKPVNNAQKRYSRPLDMFLSQLEHELFLDSHVIPDLQDQKNISTITCSKIRNEWKAWGIWDDGWGDLPGLKWRHQHDLWAFMRETNWVRQIDLIPVPEDIGPSRKELKKTVITPEDRVERLMGQEEMYQYAKKILEKRQQRTGERKLRKDWNDPDLSQRYHEWTYADEGSSKAADTTWDWTLDPDIE